MDVTIDYDGDTWRILAKGAKQDGRIYCHLASTTRGRYQKNGWNPVQICDWIEIASIPNIDEDSHG